MNNSELFKKTEQHVTGIFNAHYKPTLVYHDLEHTRYVVNKCMEIAGHYHLSDAELLALYIAAWFHDTGYLFTDPDHHEEKSAELASEFLSEMGVEESVTGEVQRAIMSTKPPRSPVTLQEEILCDADTYNLGVKDFKASNKKVWQELAAQGTLTDKKAFNEQTIAFMKAHRFYTSYCREELEAGKQKNMKKLMKKKKKLIEPIVPEITEKMGTTKGMQTLLRLTSQNHIQLSEIADSKANILISVNAIIISVILSVLFRKLQTDPYLTIPTVIFLVSSVVTIIVAILATRPKVTSGTFEEDDVTSKKINLLFFGNFHKVPQEKYERAMRVMMKDSDYLYSSIVQDIYQLGFVLGRKYKLVRLAFNIFMVGIVLSVIAFALAVLFSSAGAAETATPVQTTGSPF